MKNLAFLVPVWLSGFFSFSQHAGNGAYPRNIDELTIRIAKDVGNPSLYFARADVYDELNDFDNANQDYMMVLDLYEKNPDSKYAGEYAKSCYRLADDYFFRKSKKSEALKFVTNGLKVLRNFKDLEILEAILVGLDDSKRQVAEEKYRTLSQKYPDDIRVNMYYAKFLEGSDPAGAAALYEKVVAADPSNRQALLSLGTIYNNEAHRLSAASDKTVYEYARKAALCFENLYKLNPSDQEVANVLLQIYTEMDEADKAKKLSAPY